MTDDLAAAQVSLETATRFLRNAARERGAQTHAGAQREAEEILGLLDRMSALTWEARALQRRVAERRRVEDAPAEADATKDAARAVKLRAVPKRR